MKSNCRKFFSANGELAFEEKSLQTQLLKNWLHEAAINFGIGNLQNLSLPILVMLLYYTTIKRVCLIYQRFGFFGFVFLGSVFIGAQYHAPIFFFLQGTHCW